MANSEMLAVDRWHSGQDYIGQRYFLLVLLAAALLHLAGAYAWSLMPKAKIVDIPVRVLNIKLSDGDTMTEAELKAIQPDTGSPATANTVPQLSHYQDKQKERQQSVAASMDKAMSDLDKAPAQQQTHAVPITTTASKHAKPVVKGKFNVRSEGTKVAAPVFPVTARQYVRDDQVAAANANATTPSGHSRAEIISHYENLISLWIQKFKVYPAEARKQSLQGETVVRIRIDRQGNILYYMLEHSTGQPLLDHAAIDMIRRANPVPAVPADYPPGDLLEFLIPVSFHLEP